LNSTSDIFCNYQQDNWSPLLPLGEFAYNNALSASTSTSPFFTNKGYHLNITVHPERELALQHACEFVVDLDELHTELRSQLSATQKHYQGPINHQWTSAPDFEVGEQAFVKAENICTTCPYKKLSEKALDRSTSLHNLVPTPVTLQLLDHLHTIHPVFHISQLEPATPNTIPNHIQPLPPPIEIDSEIEYEIVAILDSKINN
jgi:hypothetical protein